MTRTQIVDQVQVPNVPPPPPVTVERRDRVANVAFVLAAVALGAVVGAFLLWGLVGRDVFDTGYYLVLQPFWLLLGPISFGVALVAVIRQFAVQGLRRRDRVNGWAALGMAVCGALLTIVGMAASGGP